jgi:enterochelin esterase-like enzyme
MQIRVRLPFDDATLSREVTVCFPQEPAVHTTFIICADGQIVPYFAESLRQEIAANSVGLIGVHCSPTLRGQEYVEGRHDQCFQRHESFLVDVVRDWVEEQFSIQLTRENTVAFGYSCGGSFAVSMGMRHPNLFGSVIALSIAGRPVRVDKPIPKLSNLTKSRFYLVAGESEPGGMKKYMKRLADWVRKNGGQSEYRLSPGGHEFAVWQRELSRGIEWLKRH